MIERMDNEFENGEYTMCRFFVSIIYIMFHA
jgi:hypothetical protein